MIELLAIVGELSEIYDCLSLSVLPPILSDLQEYASRLAQRVHVPAGC